MIDRKAREDAEKQQAAYTQAKEGWIDTMVESRKTSMMSGRYCFELTRRDTNLEEIAD